MEQSCPHGIVLFTDAKRNFSLLLKIIYRGISCQNSCTSTNRGQNRSFDLQEIANYL